MKLTNTQIEEYTNSQDSTVSSLAKEVRELRAAIREHQAQSGHSLCWLNDVELWKHVDENAAYPHDTLPVRPEFLKNCQRYYESRVKGTKWEDPEPEKTVIQTD